MHQWYIARCSARLTNLNHMDHYSCGILLHHFIMKLYCIICCHCKHSHYIVISIPASSRFVLERMCLLSSVSYNMNRQTHKAFFEKSDFFFLCLLRPLSFDIHIQELEIEAAKVEIFLFHFFFALNTFLQLLINSKCNNTLCFHIL